jgi:hypothetical protein
MALELPSKLQKKLHFHIFGMPLKMDDINVFFSFIQIDINRKYKLYM